jgi:ABC-type sugar transport system ATPase subunit
MDVKVSGSLEEPIVEIEEAVKTYGGSAAVDGVTLTLFRGEIYGLLGENGAGKSTLAKALAGVVPLTSGRIKLRGVEGQPLTPKAALTRGVAMVFQESSLVPTTSVAQNLYLGHEMFWNRSRSVVRSAQAVLDSLKFPVDAKTVVADLGAAQKQMVEIARAVVHKASVIIFDEPTTSLTPAEKQSFFDLMHRLKAGGVTILFITHALEDALAHCDRITVLRDGKHIMTDTAQMFDLPKLVRAMIGRDLEQTMYGRHKEHFRAPSATVLSARNLSMTGGVLPKVRNSSFEIAGGQVTGVFGLVGAGRSETFKVIAGLLRRDRQGGEILLRGRPVRYKSPRAAVKDGIAYITEDRKVDGFFPTMRTRSNIYIGRLAKLGQKRSWLSRKEEVEVGARWTEILAIRAVSRNARVVELSGGNQQKVVIARALAQDPDIIIFDEPTKGVDVGAIAEIHALINRLADDGKAVIIISSYLPELMALSDRVLVARKGSIVADFSGTKITEEKIMLAAIH